MLDRPPRIGCKPRADWDWSIEKEEEFGAEGEEGCCHDSNLSEL